MGYDYDTFASDLDKLLKKPDLKKVAPDISGNTAASACAIGNVAGVDCWIEDFRKDVAKNNVPTLIVHGDTDRILPPDATSRRQAQMTKHVKFVELPGGSHGVLWTHADRINSELVSFLA